MAPAMDMETAALRQTILDLNRQANAEWKQSLCPRKMAELEFHDQARGEEVAGERLPDSRPNRRFYSTVQKSKDYMADWVTRNSPGKVFLDHACGDGENAIRAAKSGAKLAIGLDISGASVENAIQNAAREGVSANTIFLQADCEDTKLPAGCVDVAICSGMLHHLDLSYAFPELRRIMKPGALCLAVEALDYNPVIRAYRFLTPHLRTEWEIEHILSMKDLRFGEYFFDVKNVKFWHMASIACTPFRNTPLFRPLLAAANAVDSVLTKCYPLSLWSWQFSFELHRRLEEEDQQPVSHTAPARKAA